MRAGNILYGLVFLAGAGVYAAMLLWTLPAITEAAGGLMPFDMRPFGYTHTEAVNFLAALTPEGLSLYLGPQAWLDRAYPALLGLGTLPRVVLVVAALAGAGLDYFENARVHAMLLAGPQGTTETMAQAASLATVLKSGLVTFCLTALLLLVLWRGWRRLRGVS